MPKFNTGKAPPDWLSKVPKQRVHGAVASRRRALPTRGAEKTFAQWEREEQRRGRR